ncbi:predicted protein [Streptomyces viridochromogenes DSM 40736]|uniref:Predicted protein n=1 Tax=Streptomyces viridochromogenes (strain DSM 40736 / JCM 4977 / BCRC 1201 / Tue 494) TaxID=591159 RepID=D9X0B3_STRVT|nr:hypothetical protein [Streptomyces viridochromogenes]EFL35497.1 predicted protein [Streptomyces viridochromogenes DSM 40736]
MPGELDKTHAEIAAAGREALADVQRAADETTAAIIRVIEQQTGISLRPPTAPSVMDATREQLQAADTRAQHALAATEIVLRRWTWGDAQTLGELMPSLPEEVREIVAEHLVRAGLS